MNPFTLERVPPNVRLQRWIGRCLPSRILAALPARLGALLGSLPFIPSVGCVRYLDGKTILFNGRNQQFHALYEDCYKHGYELETSLLVSLLLRGGGTFVDAGANWGCFGLLAAALPEFTGMIVCYEPNPASFADLASCVRQAGLRDRISTRNMGLGAAPGELRLAPSTVGHSGLMKLMPGGNGAVVTITTIDAESLPEVALIKVDVEGMELEVLQGAQHTLNTLRPALIVENLLHHAEPGLTLEPIRWLQLQDYALFAPAALVRRGKETLALPYGSPAPLSGDVLETKRMTFLPVTPANRFLLPAQLNLLGLPREKLASLPGEVIN